jgi:hypothetical protein
VNACTQQVKKTAKGDFWQWKAHSRPTAGQELLAEAATQRSFKVVSGSKLVPGALMWQLAAEQQYVPRYAETNEAVTDNANECCAAAAAAERG